jgi:hypothetical protein
VERLVRAGADVLVIDTAHGHTASVMETIKYVRRSTRQSSWWPGTSRRRTEPELWHAPAPTD